MAKNRIETLARGLLVRENAVLMCRNRKHGYLYLPGGHVEFGETAAAALEREMREETGLACRVGSVIVVHEELFEQRGEPRHEMNVVFHVEHLEGVDGRDPVPSAEEHIAFEWLDLAGVMSADIRPTSIRAFLASGGTIEPTAAWWSAVSPT